MKTDLNQIEPKPIKLLGLNVQGYPLGIAVGECSQKLPHNVFRNEDKFLDKICFKSLRDRNSMSFNHY